MNTTFTLFYDGACHLCSREIAHYRRCAEADPSVAFVDISAPDFVAAAHGLDARRVHKEMHAKEGDAVHVGVDAFLAIWRRVPGHRWMHRLATLPGAYWPLKAGYALFAAVRPYLPRRKPACETGACAQR